MRRIERKLCWNKGVTGSDGLRVSESSVWKFSKFQKKFGWKRNPSQPVTTRHSIHVPVTSSVRHHGQWQHDNNNNTEWWWHASTTTTWFTMMNLDERWWYHAYGCSWMRRIQNNTRWTKGFIQAIMMVVVVVCHPLSVILQSAFVGDDCSSSGSAPYTQYTTMWSPGTASCLRLSWYHHRGITRRQSSTASPTIISSMVLLLLNMASIINNKIITASIVI